MLEIVLLIFLGRKIAARAKEKGCAGWPFVLMLIALWFGGEIVGAIGGAILVIGAGGNEDSGFFLVWLCGVAGAAIGAVVSFAIVSALPAAVTDDYDDDYSYRDDYRGTDDLDPRWRDYERLEGRDQSSPHIRRGPPELPRDTDYRA